MKPTTQEPTIAVIVCTYCRPEPLTTLLRALRDQVRMADELIVVDGSPNEDTEAVIHSANMAGAHPQIRYVQVGAKDRGLTRQRNIGIDMATSDLVAFLDDDTVPDPAYLSEIVACFERHPDALGVGGRIGGGTEWRQLDSPRHARLATYQFGGWERREDYRRRLRRVLGLESPLPPGWMPPFGHGRSADYPPDGADHAVEFVMGGASCWRRSVFSQVRFSSFFEGYGLYEDLDFSVRVSRDGPLYLCTGASLLHNHAPSGRPNQFRYGVMVVRNGWYVWRQRWPMPNPLDRCKWWMVTLLLTLCRFGDALRGPARMGAFTEGCGRLWGAMRVWLRPPRPETNDV